jgi:hypothetical protein
MLALARNEYHPWKIRFPEKKILFSGNQTTDESGVYLLRWIISSFFPSTSISH